MLKQQQYQDSPIQNFHKKIINQLTFHLKSYQKLQNKNNLTNQAQSQAPPNKLNTSLNGQHFSYQSISQFLYDILQLQNSSIDFIMKQIFEANKRNLWHMQEIIKIILDVQFVITVNNFILSKHQNNKKTKIKQQDISFFKISPVQLVQVLLQSCFFVKNKENIISKQLLHSIAQQINVQNGNKGHILLVQYKNFMLHNIIQKHNIRKFVTPKKINQLTPQINRQKYLINKQIIRQVDEESQAMGKSNRNFQSIQFAKHGQQNRIVNQNKQKQTSLKNHQSQVRDNEVSIQMPKQKKQHKTIPEQKQDISFQYFQQLLWKSIRNIISPLWNSQNKHLSHNQILQRTKNSLIDKLTNMNTKSIQRVNSRIDRYFMGFKRNVNVQGLITLLIRLLGQESFKNYHDQQNKSYPKKEKYCLFQEQLKQILTKGYSQLLQTNQPTRVISRIVENITKNNYLINNQDFVMNQREFITFKDFLVLIQKLSQYTQE